MTQQRGIGCSIISSSTWISEPLETWMSEARVECSAWTGERSGCFDGRLGSGVGEVVCEGSLAA
jgi:hypothetical protein